MSSWIRLCAILLLLAAPFAQTAGAAPASPAQPDGGTVGNGTSGSCTDTELHAKVPGGGVVTFNCGGPKTIDVASLMFITEDTVINGGGVITLTGGMITLLFVVNSGVKLTLSGLVLDDFYGPGQNGGVIQNHGTLTLTAVTIQNSLTDNSHAGGAIYNDGGALTISASVFKNNRAGYGGAIYAEAGPLAITNTRFTSNYTTHGAEAVGGAIYVGTNVHLSYTDGLLVSNSSIAGGALYLDRDSVTTLTSTYKGHDECPVAAAGFTDAPQLCALGGQSALSPALEGPPNYTELNFVVNHADYSGGAIFNMGQLTIDSLELLQNSVPITQDTYGGAIANYGTLALYNTQMLINQAGSGGALYVGANNGSGPSTVVIDDGYLAVNKAGANGGALYTDAPGMTITVTDSLFLNNEAGTAGGGLFRENAPLSVARSSFVLNEAALGGALFLSTDPENPGVGGTVTIRDTTISTNTGTFLAGAIFNADWLSLTSVTLVDNFVGVYTSSLGSWHLKSSVLRNAAFNCNGDHQPVDDGHNYATDLSCGFTTSTQGNGLDPKLGPLSLGDDLPLTYYHPQQPGSPLKNQGAADCAVLDQLGHLRVDTCDIGAIEDGAHLPFIYLPLIRR